MGDSEIDFDDTKEREKFTVERNKIEFKPDDNDDFDSAETNLPAPRNNPIIAPRASIKPAAVRRQFNSEPRNNFERSSGPRHQYGNRNFINRRPREVDYTRRMSFKDFTNLQDDKITPQEATEKYEGYLQEFDRRQLPVFFDKHKFEKWFLDKFHPYFLTLERIRQIRYFRKRLDCFQFLLKNNVQVSFDAEFTDLMPILKVINMCLERADEENILGALEKIKTSKIGEIDMEVGDLSIGNPVKRKFGESFTSSHESSDFYRANTAVEIRSIPSNVKPKLFFDELKRTRGFLRAYVIGPTNFGTNTYRILATFKPSIEFEDIKESVSDISVEDATFECVRYNDTFPIIKIVKGPYDLLSVALRHAEVLIGLIDMLDKEIYIYSDRYPELPSYNPTFKKWDATVDDFDPSELKSESESETQSGSEAAEELLTENKIISQVKDFIRQFSANTDDTSVSPPELLSLIDKMVLYLRVVHSFDFYSFIYEPQEHDSPCRCKIVHVRKSVDSSLVNRAKVESAIKEIEKQKHEFLDYINRFNGNTDESKSDLKDPELEVQKYMDDKVKEIRTNVWLCHLCQKKFKGKEFVVKHIQSKHSNYTDAIKCNAVFFNNFANDWRLTCNKPITPHTPVVDKSEDIGHGSFNFDAFHTETTKRKKLAEYTSFNDLDMKEFDF